MAEEKADIYLQALKKLYKYNFDLEEDKSILDKKFDLYAFSRVQHEQYFATKSIKIWSYNNYEHCLVNKVSDKQDRQEVNKKFFDDLIKELVKVHRGHKQSYITYVEVWENFVSQKQIDEIENFSHSHSFWFGLRGWCDVRLVLVDLKQDKVYINKKAEEVSEYYQPQQVLDYFERGDKKS